MAHDNGERWRTMAHANSCNITKLCRCNVHPETALRCQAGPGPAPASSSAETEGQGPAQAALTSLSLSLSFADSAAMCRKGPPPSSGVIAHKHSLWHCTGSAASQDRLADPPTAPRHAAITQWACHVPAPTLHQHSGAWRGTPTALGQERVASICGISQFYFSGS